MAAKVVMVAVPTVLGIASIRVYTVNEASADGMVTREKLNIYTPLQGSAQTKFVPDSPGVIERGLTTTRESVLPLVQAVKGAGVSVKKGSVNLYHAGEDVYYYLIDPPPGFLPRLGTITMAGLLGMFLARKGSRFKQLAVPVGLMSAGASVCYPAQAVAVLKVTGKKVHAAGQWSSAAVSSLFTPKEPVAKEIVASQLPLATEPNPEFVLAEESSAPSSTTETSAQSATIPEKEVESAESDKPTVTTEEESSVTLTELSPDQTPAESSAGSLVNSAPEASDVSAEQGADDVSTDTSPDKVTPSLEPETTQAVPVELSSAEPTESAPEASGVPAASATEAAVDDVSFDTSPAEVILNLEPEPTEAVPVEASSADSAESAPSEVTSAPEASHIPAAADVSTDTRPADVTPSLEPETTEAVPAEPVSPEVTSAPEASHEPSDPVIESAESVPAAELDSADQHSGPAVEETLNTTLTPPPPPPQQPTAENSKEGSGFKPDPALMDFGQSNPEDEDLYSTRS
ncbi:MICOS complex subunit MIC27 [Melanotaenia boesemani]|uniref:MICOS complex subunit MIC27 n=1 Tax=Melanotaenia boesemani TaxID=1250792 RepID=UPI001C05E730|nr:MICOS complex subunit MIC27 [Melanotaenia boesemani]